MVRIGAEAKVVPGIHGYVDRQMKGSAIRKKQGGRGGEATRPGTEKRCSHNLQSDPLGSGFKKGRENFPL